MKFSKKLRLALILISVFSVSFPTVYFAIFFNELGYSTPSNYLSSIGSMSIGLGPPPNSTDIPLNTVITVDAVASAALNDLHLIPEVPIARVYSEASSSLTYLNIFYPAQLLEPATKYNVSVTILDVPVSWIFITTSKSFSPGIKFYLATNVVWISLMVAALATVVVGFAVWSRYRQV